MRFVFAFAMLSSFLFAACNGRSTAPSTDLTACTAAGQCALVPQSCCGQCGVPSANDMTAVLFDKTSDYRREVCGTTGMACSRCAGMEDPHLTAVCRQSKCVALDVRTDAMTECASDADCTLRFAGVCCEPCAGGQPDNLIALSLTGAGEYKNNLCRPASGACSPCIVARPPGYGAKCDTTKHCVVSKSASDGGSD